MSQSKIDSKADERKQWVEKLRRLFKETQALPHVQAISEEMIAEEIEKTRNI